jgi:hypothetical protein
MIDSTLSELIEIFGTMTQRRRFHRQRWAECWNPKGIPQIAIPALNGAIL